MASIGIIANPASGKDIRRLVSYATTIDNQEKVNIVKRIVLAAQAMGVDTFWFMPDTFQIGWTVISERLRVGCIVVLGGDGTSRAVAKGIEQVPILPLSTGTNNVYPEMIEGTVAGMAAAAVAQFADPSICCMRDKQIEVRRNGALTDIALVDAVISDDLWIGSKAIWDPAKIRRIFVTRCHPANIGFSTAAGCLEIVTDTDDYGLAVKLEAPGKKIIAPIAAGILSELEIAQAKRMPLDCPEELVLEDACMIALDGERELRGQRGDTLTFTVTKNGPWRVQAKKALEEAVRQNLFGVTE